MGSELSVAVWTGTPVLHGGSMVSGHVDVTGAGPVPPMVVQLVAVETTGGDVPRRTAREVARTSLGVTSGQLAPVRLPFHLTAPLDVVPGYATPHHRVDWFLVACEANRKDGVRGELAVAVAVDPRQPLPPPLPPTAAIRARSFDRRTNVGLSVLMTAVFAGLALFSLAQGATGGYVLGAVFLAFAGLGVWLVRRDAARASSSIAGVRAVPRIAVVRAGSDVVVDYDVGTRQGLELGLVGEEWYRPAVVTAREGKQPYDRTVLLHEAWHSAGVGAGVAALRVPPDALPSYHGETVAVVWSVQVRQQHEGNRMLDVAASATHLVPVTVRPPA